MVNYRQNCRQKNQGSNQTSADAKNEGNPKRLYATVVHQNQRTESTYCRQRRYQNRFTGREHREPNITALLEAVQHMYSGVESYAQYERYTQRIAVRVFNANRCESTPITETICYVYAVL